MKFSNKNLIIKYDCKKQIIKKISNDYYISLFNNVK